VGVIVSLLQSIWGPTRVLFDLSIQLIEAALAWFIRIWPSSWHFSGANFGSIESTSIAIRNVGGGQQHVGIVYRDRDAGLVRFLHLADHHDLRHGNADPRYLGVRVAINEDRLVQVAALCRMIWESNGSHVPYGFSAPWEAFDPATGELLIGPSVNGLTCATFVLAVFHAAGLPLIRYRTWPVNRPGDVEWQQHVVQHLWYSGAEDEHIQAVSVDVGCVRFRPEEVAAAATMRWRSVGFRATLPRAREVISRL
jgi:hypothetical protein